MTFLPPALEQLVARYSASNLTLTPLPHYDDDLELVTAYLVQRMLSHASWVYAYILWIAVGAVFFGFSALRWSGMNGGYLGAVWNKWALRRRTWRKKHALALAAKTGQPHRQPKSLPSNAQMFTLVILIVSSLALCFIGPDYLAPGSYIWNLNDYPSAHLSRRGYDLSKFYYLQPQFTINKTWWTSGGRTGLIAFALFPLTVLLALKSPPFAIFSLPYFTQFCFDKLAFLHRWCGVLTWFITTLHVVSWSIQIRLDDAYSLAWLYMKFRYAWTAYICFTVLMICSLPPIRQRHYELFYLSHILCVPLTLIFSALHHPPVWWWCWAALALWVGERSYRFTWWLYTNGFFGGLQAPCKTLQKQTTKEVGPDTLPMHTLGQRNALGKLPGLPHIDTNPKLPVHRSVSMTGSHYTPPPGFVHAELLPGKTVRVRIVTPGFISWVPGQHFLISIPAISALTSHPFTCASVCDAKSSDAGREIVFYIRAKRGWTKQLWDAVALLTANGQKYPPGEKVASHYELPARGVIMRGFVDGPFGSAARAQWRDYSSVVLMAGGSGVSFAMSVLQYACLCMAGRDGRDLGGLAGGFGKPNFKINHVRFVWLVREFGHVHWCASILRRCMEMVSPSELQIDIFVTNAKPITRHLPAPDIPESVPEEPLSPPAPPFALDDGSTTPPTPGSPKRTSVTSVVSVTSSHEEDDEMVDLSYYTQDIAPEERGELGHDEHVLDLTNFEGDDDTALPGEALLNAAVRQEGRVRRSFMRQSHIIKPESGYTQREGLGSKLRPWHSRPPRPTSAAMMSLAPVTSRLSMIVASPLSTTTVTTPNSSVPLLQGHDKEKKFTFPPTQVSLHPVAHEDSRSSSPTLRPESVLSNFSDAHSLAALVSEAAAREQIRLELGEEEIMDISVVAEHARAGRPNIQKILADEVEQSRGSVIVGCCGPTSLNAVVRKNVAALISPSRIAKGDRRGHISLVAEDFEY